MTSACLLLLALSMPGPGVEIEFLPTEGAPADAVPEAGASVPLRVTLDGEPADGAVVTATYRPGSNVELVTDVGLTRSDGTIEWVAEHPGLAQLSATVRTGRIEGVDQTASAKRTVSVRFRGTPWSGVLVFLAAGGFLFGGAAFALKKLLG